MVKFKITPESMKGFTDHYFTSGQEIVEFFAENFFKVSLYHQLKFFQCFLHREDLYAKNSGESIKLVNVRNFIYQWLNQNQLDARPNFIWLLLSQQNTKRREDLLNGLAQEFGISPKKMVRQNFKQVLDNRIVERQDCIGVYEFIQCLPDSVRKYIPDCDYWFTKREQSQISDNMLSSYNVRLALSNMSHWNIKKFVKRHYEQVIKNHVLHISDAISVKEFLLLIPLRIRRKLEGVDFWLSEIFI